MMLLFLGAGASASFGIPDTKSFVSEFERVIGSNEIYKALKSSIQMLDTEVLMTVLHDLSKPKEELMNSLAPHTARLLLEKPSDITHLTADADVKIACQQMLRRVKETIRAKCLQQIKDSKPKILDTYDRFFQGLSLRPEQPTQAGDRSGMKYPAYLFVFTTNYDTCMETYFNARQVQCDMGHSNRFGEYVLDIDPWLHQAAAGGLHGRSIVQLIKLHGSIDLFAKDNKVRFLPGGSAGDTSAITSLGEEYGSEALLYPIESNIPLELLQSPFIEQLHYLKNRLAAQNIWVIIGSAFRDLTLVSLMNDVVMKRGTADLAIMHINPRATRVSGYLQQKGYEGLAKAIKPIDEEFMSEAVAKELAKIRQVA